MLRRELFAVQEDALQYPLIRGSIAVMHLGYRVLLLQPSITITLPCQVKSLHDKCETAAHKPRRGKWRRVGKGCAPLS